MESVTITTFNDLRFITSSQCCHFPFKFIIPLHIRSIVNVTSGGETMIVRDNSIKTIADDALTPHVARSFSAMVLAKKNKRILVYHQEEFQLYAP